MVFAPPENKCELAIYVFIDQKSDVASSPNDRMQQQQSSLTRSQWLIEKRRSPWTALHPNVGRLRQCADFPDAHMSLIPHCLPLWTLQKAPSWGFLK